MGDLPPECHEAEVDRLVLAEASRLFDLERGPLLRASLFRLASEEHVLFQVEHHLVHDGWAETVLLGDLLELYSALVAGRRPTLRPLPIQFADFARWQREWLQGEALEHQLTYWRTLLEGAPTLLELPTDFARPPVRSARGAVLDVVLPATFATDLAAFSRERGVTLFMAMLAAFNVLLSRLSGQRDLVVGMGIANRRHPETEGLLGMFINTLALRTDLTLDPSASDLLHQVRDRCLSVYAHQDLPFDRLVEALRPERSLSQAPIFQVFFAFHDARFPELNLPDLRLRPSNPHNRSAKFDMVVIVTPPRELGPGGTEDLAGITVHTEYSTDLFERVTIQRMVGAFGRLLAEFTAQPGCAVSELPLLDAAQRHQICTEWNATAGPYELDVRLEELFERQAGAAPERLALACADGRSWTYGELEERANQLAHLLLELGVAPGELVAVRLSRGPEMVRAVLGILKAGGAYVPIEVNLPLGRVQLMLAALSVRYLVTESPRLGEIVTRLGELPALVHLVTLDLPDTRWEPATLPRRHLWGWADLERRPSARVARRGSATDLAYVIFTSGSTGTPKGVMVRHRPVLNVIQWLNDGFAIGPADRILFLAALGFDLSVYDIFGILAAGGSIRIADEQETGEPSRLVAILCREPITIWDTAPAALQQLVPFLEDAPGDPHRRPLRRVLLSGDWIPVSLPEKVREAFPHAQILALGGATEATIWSNCFVVEEVDRTWSSIPYGRPIRNAQYRVLDAHLAPCPHGVAGDLFIGGECLAVGYAGDPVQTAIKFVPDPFAAAPGAILYRTGDRARFRNDGVLQFLGRQDSQVKIRGYRIELGEIQSLLLEHPAVEDAVVLVREDQPGERRLVAYLVAHEPPDPADLRALLRDRLPDYMVPAAYVFLERMPTTANGKLDRRALPAPSDLGPCRIVPPRTPTERTLATIWADLLKIPEVGVESDFFALGGHSLIATQLMADVRRTFEVDLPLRTLFQSPTIATLAETIDTSRRTATGEPGAERQLPRVVPVPAERHQPFPLNDVQQAYWLGRSDLFELGSVSSHNYSEVDAYDLDLPALESALQTLIERHDMLRAVLLPEGRQKILDTVPPLSIPVEDLRGRPDAGERLAEIRERMSHQVLPGDRWPLFDVCASRLDGGRVRLHFSRDALIGDAWSFQLLNRELLAPLLRLNRAAGTAVALVPRLCARRIEPEGHRALSRGGTLLARARRRPAARSRAASRPQALSRCAPVRSPLRAPRSGRMDALKERAAARGLTTSGCILACFAEVLAAWSKEPRFTLNVTLFNRLPLHPEVDRIVGDFTSLVLLAVDGAEQPSFEGRARRIQGQLWQDLDHRYVSGVEVLRWLARARRLPPGAILPVVLTSSLTLPNREVASGATGMRTRAGLRDLADSPGLARPSGRRSRGRAGVQLGRRRRHLPGWDARRHVSGVQGPALRFSPATRAHGMTASSTVVPTKDRRRIEANNATSRPLPPGALLQTLCLEAAKRTPEAYAVVARRHAAPLSASSFDSRPAPPISCANGEPVRTGWWPW